MFGTLSQPRRSCLAGLCLSLSCFSNVSASIDVCQQPTAYSHLSVAHHYHEKSSLQADLGDVRQKTYDFDLHYKLSDDWIIGAGHRYNDLSIKPLELQANGHLHTFFLPLHRTTQSDDKSFRLSVAPAISASSNVIKDPAEYSADALQMMAALVWSRQRSNRAIVRYGVCGDHRFGKFEIYPLVSVELQPGPDWTVELGFPKSQLTYRVSTSLSSSVQIAPDGNEWHVKDESLERQSDVVQKAWLLEWAFSWSVHEHFMVKAGVGKQIKNRYEMTLLNGDRVRLRTDPVTRLGLALTWRF
jgi:hypothetical protein